MFTNIDIKQSPDYIVIRTDDAKITENITDGTFKCGDIEFSHNGGKPEIKAYDTAIRRVTLRWNGKINKKIKIFCDALERNYGHFEWRGIVANRLMPWYFIADDGEKSYCTGVKTGPDSFCYFYVDNDGISLVCDTRCGGKGVILGGAELMLCELMTSESREGETPFAHLCRFCGTLCDKPVLPSEPVYGSNNWYYAYGNSSEKEILNDTKILVSLTKELKNRPYMVIDDCWQPLRTTHHSAVGRPMTCGNELFPDMPGLAKKMKDLGVRPGIWLRPLLTHEGFDTMPLHARCDRDQSVLDITDEFALKCVAEDVDRITKWGYELIKYDFSGNDTTGCWGNPDSRYLNGIRDDWSWHDRSVTTARALKNFYKTVYENANGAVIIGCNVVGHLAAGYIHIHRSGDDTSGREWAITAQMGVNTLAFRLAENNNFFKVDADCVGVTVKVPWENNRQFLDLVARSGSPLFCSVAPEALTAEVAEDIKRAFAINSVQSDKMTPLDWQDTNLPEEYDINGTIFKYSWGSPEGFRDYIS